MTERTAVAGSEAEVDTASTAGSTATAGTTPPAGSAGDRSAAGKAPAKQAAAKKTTTKKTVAKKTTTDESVTARTAAKRAPTKKAPAKTAPVRKAAPKPSSTTAATTTTRAATTTPTAGGDAPHIHVRILDNPAFAPELLALAAVRILGPEADSWVRHARLDYPAATTDGLARLATRRFVRLAAAGNAAATVAAAAGGGIFAPVAAFTTLAWTQARLVLHLAAAFGEDPTAPERATELLVLTGVHRDDASARDALRAAQDVPQFEPGLYRVAEAGWRLAAPLAVRAPAWLALRYAARRMPSLLLLATTSAGAADTERLAARATARYRARR